MFKKRLCSFALTLTIASGMLPAAALADDSAQLTEETEAQTEAVAEDSGMTIEIVDEGGEEETESTECTAAESAAEDPQEYRATHRDDTEPETDERAEELTRSTTEIMVFSNKTLKSIYTGKTYTLPSGKKITNGIDVSKWDDDISWSKVKNAGTDFAIVRCGYRGYESGGLFADEFYAQNMKNAISAGVKVGVYFYSQATTKAEARKEAQYCLDKVKGYNISAPIVMDVEYAEDSNGYTGRLYAADLSKSAQTDICLAFCEEIADAGYTPMIYANYTMLTYNMNAGTVSKKYPIWLANYTTKTSYAGDYDCWQYSESGTVNGIDYPIDCNFGIGLDLGMTKKVTLSKSTLSMAYQNTKTLKAKITPSNSTDKVSWKSSRTSVASVSSKGKITPKAVGKTTITCTSGSKKDTCSVTIRPGLRGIQMIKAVNGNVIVLTWNICKEADHYRIYRSTSKDGKYTLLEQTKDLSYRDSSVKLGQTYYYKLRTVGKQGSTLIYSSYSGAKQCVVPTRVSISGIKKLKSGNIRLNWGVAEGADYYRLYRATSKKGPFSYIGHTEKLQYTDKKDITKSKTYYYKVQGCTLVNGKKCKGKVSKIISIKA